MSTRKKIIAISQVGPSCLIGPIRLKNGVASIGKGERSECWRQRCIGTGVGTVGHQVGRDGITQISADKPPRDFPIRFRAQEAGWPVRCARRWGTPT